MTTKDVRDMLGLSQEQGPKPKASKKKAKVTEKRPDGITRELFALMGERAPPIPIAQPVNYKAKPTRPLERVKWSWTPFQNDARLDDLVMRHWMKTTHANPSTAKDVVEPPTPAMDASDKPEESNQDQQQPPSTKSSYPFVKYNREVSVPQYTTEQYDTQLQDDNWTRDETDYLIETFKDCYGKWPVVVDRYEYQPPVTRPVQSTEEPQPVPQVQPSTTERSMEDLKKRYYSVLAKTMAIQTPISQMNTAEYETHTILTNWDREQELRRKKTKEALLTRGKEEKREEELLLAELRRIYHGQEKFALEVKEVRDRFDHSITDDRGDAAAYTTSAEINALMQRFVHQGGNKKRRPGAPDGAAGSAASPTTAGGPHTQGQGQKRCSLSATNANLQQSPGGSGASAHIRHLSTTQQARFGIVPAPSSDPQQTGGVSSARQPAGIAFATDRMGKIRGSTKSAAVKAKIDGVLAELRLPELLQTPTLAVVSRLERLVGRVLALMDLRRAVEKAGTEVRVEEERKGVRGEKGESGTGEDDAGAADAGDDGEAGSGEKTKDQAVKAEPPEGDAEDGDAAAAGDAEAAGSSAGPVTAGRATRGAASKRSASVLSVDSTASTRSRSKRKKAN